MAPRVRQKKVGLTRMDAAVDALTPMGYSPDFIRAKVKELLKVYGDQGWAFIEEASYSLLLECILENEGHGQREQGDASHQIEDKDQGTMEIEPSGAGPSQEPSKALCDSQDTPLLSPVTVLNPLLPPAETGTSPSAKHTGHSESENGFPSPGFEDICWTKVYPKRKPCLGWIGPKDDEDFILLQPAPVRGWKTGENRRKRKSRWDFGPHDIV